jgi:hypothetical protein
MFLLLTEDWNWSVLSHNNGEKRRQLERNKAAGK